jgi:UDP-glucuronate 4-epimerase
MGYIFALEKQLSTMANKELLPIQQVDLSDTYADVEDLFKEFDYKPNTLKNEGFQNLGTLYQGYHIL